MITLPAASVEGWTSHQAAAAAGITYRQLDWWDRVGLVGPSITTANGYGTRRLYSLKDVVTLRACKRLIDLGMSLTALRPIAEWLNLEDNLPAVTLVWDGTEIWAYDPAPEIDMLLETLRQGPAYCIDIAATTADVRQRLAAISEAAA